MKKRKIWGLGFYIQMGKKTAYPTSGRPPGRPTSGQKKFLIPRYIGRLGRSTGPMPGHHGRPAGRPENLKNSEQAVLKFWFLFYFILTRIVYFSYIIIIVMLKSIEIFLGMKNSIKNLFSFLLIIINIYISIYLLSDK